MKKVCKIIAALLLASAFLIPMTVGAVPTAGTDGGATSQKPADKTFYLPPYIDLSAVAINIEADRYGYAANAVNIKIPSDKTIDVTRGETKDGYGNACYKVWFSGESTSEAYTFYSCAEIPSVFVGTSKGISYIHSGKNNRDKESRVIIADENGKTVYDDVTAGTFSEFKGRGNATWSYAKKPYQIKLSSKTDLFGMGKAKTWILLANYIDSSFIRNAVAYEIADSLGLPYTPKSTFVNLCVDNVFTGLYQLIEKTQIGKNRIEIADLEEENELAAGKTDIDSLPAVTVRTGEFVYKTIVTSYSYVSGMTDPADITGGYLIELDNLYSGAEKCKFTTINGNTYVLKSPECASKAEVEYIAEIFSDFEEAMYSDNGYNPKGRHYSEYCDIDSLAKVYTTEEITKNWDAYIGSIYFYKDAGADSKLYAGPVWDFDNTWGNLSNGTFSKNRTELWADGNNDYGGAQYQNDFGGALMFHDDAKALAAKYYDEAAKTASEMLGENGFISELTAKIYDSVSADKARWGTERNRAFKQFAQYISGDENSAIGYLRGFMSDRITALYSAFGLKAPSERPDETTSSAISIETTETETTNISDTTTLAPVTDSSATSATEAPLPHAPKTKDIIIMIAACIIAIAVITVIMRQKKNK